MGQRPCVLRTCWELSSSKMVKDGELLLTGEPVNSMVQAVEVGRGVKMQALGREMTVPDA